MMQRLRAIPPLIVVALRARHRCRTRACDPRGSWRPAARSCCRRKTLPGQVPGQSPSLQAAHEEYGGVNRT